ncbi:MAG: AMP-binding protein [Thermoanaerobaculales bacterium]|nr:AMP-binding protein [Thermoanaerobaculales bacterium]
MTDRQSDLQAELWRQFVQSIQRNPNQPFEAQWARYSEIFTDRDPALPPPPAWVPGADRLRHANISTMMNELGIDDYQAFHRWTCENRADFWGRVVDRLGIVFSQRPDQVLDLSSGPSQPRWFPGAELNIVSSCFLGEGYDIAVVAGREGSDDMEAVTYEELEMLVNLVANGLAASGFAPGDAIALYMPMNLECVAAYLGIIRAGCAVVSIADSFAAPEVARRLQISDATAIITVSSFQRGGRSIELYQTVRDADATRAIVIAAEGFSEDELRDGDLLWWDFLSDSTEFEALTATPSAVTNILFSSGTTGDPKAIPWTHLTPIKCAMDGHFHHDIQRGDVVAWPTNIGWMMGPWLIYATLINRGCIALYEGLPSGRGFSEFVNTAGVGMLGVVPSLVRAWRDSGACDGVDWSRINVLSSTGEPSNRQDYLWLMSRTGYRAPVIEYCGGTEIGGGHLTGTVVQPASPATFSTAALGMELVILDEEDQPVAEGEEGELFLVPPSIGLSQTLLNRDHDEVYYRDCPSGPNGEVLRRHGDQVAWLPGGYFAAQGRADDTMNLGGIKVSSLELERVLEHHPAVYETAAVAVQPGGEGAEKLVVFAVLSEEIEKGELQGALGITLAKDLNPLFRIHDVVIVDSLPRTASNKLMRRELRSQYTE